MIRRIHLFESSSAQLAVFFSGLLALAAVLLSIEMMAITQGDLMETFYAKLVMVLLGIVCACLFALSFFVTKRINTIVDTVNHIIATTDLSQRIPVDSRWDDLSKLSLTLNHLLAEIEQLVNGMRTLSDNIAHDLRHPLTRMRNHIESMKAETKDNAQQTKLTELSQECDGLLTTFQALLRISNIESGKRHSAFTRMNLTQLLDDVVELYEPLASEKSITLGFEATPVEVTGDKDLLFQAFANLIDNAIKYTPANGAIAIAVSLQENGKAKVIITDTGLGVSDEHKERVFRRFYRVEHSRRASGSGLGLSLVAAIIKLHQGIIQLHDNKPSGLIVTVTI